MFICEPAISRNNPKLKKSLKLFQSEKFSLKLIKSTSWNIRDVTRDIISELVNQIVTINKKATSVCDSTFGQIIVKRKRTRKTCSINKYQ